MNIPFPQIDWASLSTGAVLALLFTLRGTDLALSTLRVLSVIRGRRVLTWFISFFEAFLFILGAAGLLANLDQPLSILAYAAGFATGTAVGLTIERRFIPGNSMLRIYSVAKGDAIVESLRERGRGATEVAGRGLSGAVDLIFTFVRRRQEDRVRKEIVALDPEAVITVENVRVLAGGWDA